MNPASKAFAATLLASVIAVSMTACSKDLPTDPANNPAAGEPQADVVIAQAPTNDDFDAAEVIPGLPFTDSDNTTEATPGADDPPDCFGGETSPTVWYQFTPTEDTHINANTIGSDYDTGLSVYTGTRGDLTEIACNDDAAGGRASAVTFDAIAGVTYFFKVGAFGGGDGGNLVFNVSVAPPPLEVSLTIDGFATVNPTTGIAIVRGTATCSRDVSVELSGELQQRISRAVIFGFFSASVECDGVTQWEAEVFPQNGKFAGGRAAVSASAFFIDRVFGEVAFADASATVRLRGAGK
jgi:hypothetical protein